MDKDSKLGVSNPNGKDGSNVIHGNPKVHPQQVVELPDLAPSNYGRPGAGDNLEKTSALRNDG